MSSLLVVRSWRVVIALGLVAAGLIVSGAARASAVTCKRTPLPNVGSDNELRGVSVTSSRNAWAVGSDGGRALIEHWNGRAWKVQASPKLVGELSAVAATSSTNAWAVGYYGQLFGTRERETRTLIEHWNGRSWKIQPSPKPSFHLQGLPLAEIPLMGVAATSSTNAWAVGYGYWHDNSNSATRTLIEHWNGKAWKIQASAKLRFSALSGVSATSSTNAWAVGEYHTAPPEEYGKTVIEHWNGRSWKIQPSPNPSFNFHPINGQQGPDEIPLMGVAATSSTNAWLVGYADWDLDDYIFVSRTLIEHWNGKAWKIQPSPNERSSPLFGGEPVDNQLYAVAATSSTDAWAVGWPIKGATIWQWNGGQAWKAQASPKRGAALYAVAAKSSNIWAVGADYGTALNRYDAWAAGNGHPHKGVAVHCVSSSSG
jgi:hypothetical protein